MDLLEQARDLVKAGDYEMLDMLYDSVPGVLSELIRTAFIPRPGYKFVVSDFSAIEARVLYHLAGETWRAEVFHKSTSEPAGDSARHGVLYFFVQAQPSYFSHFSFYFLQHSYLPYRKKRFAHGRIYVR